MPGSSRHPPGQGRGRAATRRTVRRRSGRSGPAAAQVRRSDPGSGRRSRRRPGPPTPRWFRASPRRRRACAAIRVRRHRSRACRSSPRSSPSCAPKARRRGSASTGSARSHRDQLPHLPPSAVDVAEATAPRSGRESPILAPTRTGYDSILREVGPSGPLRQPALRIADMAGSLDQLVDRVGRGPAGGEVGREAERWIERHCDHPLGLSYPVGHKRTDQPPRSRPATSADPMARSRSPRCARARTQPSERPPGTKC